MKHVFYVIYVLFYTGAIFVTGLFVGQLLERSWVARRESRLASSGAEAGAPSRGAVAGQPDAAATSSKRQ